MGGPLNKSIFAFSMIAFEAGNYVPFRRGHGRRA